MRFLSVIRSSYFLSDLINSVAPDQVIEARSALKPAILTAAGSEMLKRKVRPTRVLFQ